MNEFRREQTEPQLEPNSEKQKPEYNFEMMAEIEPAIVSLVEQLKDKIETGEYGALLSDEVGGRIPTLILRKIMRDRCPDKNLETYFLSGGHYLRLIKEDSGILDRIENYLKTLVAEKSKVLVITEYVFNGETLKNMGKVLEGIGIENFDFAAVHNAFGGDRHGLPEDFWSKFGSKLYIGADKYMSRFSQEHEQLSGVKKRFGQKWPREESDMLPYPETEVEHIRKYGREFTLEEINNIFGITEDDKPWDVSKKHKDPEKIAEYQKRSNEPLSDNEKAEIQEKIKLAREDVATMANRVIGQVWK